MLHWKRKIFSVFFVLIIGGLGGVLADQFLLPYLAVKPPFSNIDFIHQAGNGTTIINPTQEIIISENEAIEHAIEGVSSSLALVRSFDKNRLLSQGTGFVMTSDGLLITTGDVVESQANKYLVYQNGDSYQAELVKKDLEKNIALLRIESEGLKMVAIAEPEEISLGRRVILIGVNLIDDHLTKFVNLGIIRSIDNDKIELNFQETNVLANGSPLVDDRGELIGMNLINEKSGHKVISSKIIRSFAGL